MKEYAALFNYSKHNFWQKLGENPFAFVRQWKIKARERFIHPDEFERFFAALNNMQNDVTRDYILLSLYTGARRANVLAMRWTEIDLTLGLWRISDTKNGDSHTIPLTSPALEVLHRRKLTAENEWVLPGKLPNNHLIEPKRAWLSLLKEANIRDLRLHDLRRTLGSYMAMANYSLTVIGQALGHRSSASTEIYARLHAEPVRQAMERAQQIMLSNRTLA